MLFLFRLEMKLGQQALHDCDCRIFHSAGFRNIVSLPVSRINAMARTPHIRNSATLDCGKHTCVARNVLVDKGIFQAEMFINALQGMFIAFSDFMSIIGCFDHNKRNSLSFLWALAVRWFFTRLFTICICGNIHI